MKSSKISLVIFAIVVLCNDLIAQPISLPWRSMHFSNDTSGARFFGESLEVKAKCLDIWGKGDDFHFVYQPIKGNLQFTARIAEITKVNPDPWAKGGIMVRNSLTHDSRHFSVLITPEHGHAVQMRLEDAGTSDGISSVYGSEYQWIRLVRVGREVIASISKDGKDWKVIYGHQVELNDEFYVGFAVSSHDSTKTLAVKFSDISIVSEGNDRQAPLAPPSISFRFVTPNIVLLTWPPATDDVNVLGYNVLSDGIQLNDRPILKNAFVIEDWNSAGRADIGVQAIDVTGKLSEITRVNIDFPEGKYVYEEPIDNPVSKSFVSNEHWTDSLPWTNVVNVTAVDGLLDADNSVDSVVLHRTIKNLSLNGGGVLFFPGGSYYFNHSIYLQTGVVLRGENPLAVTDANDFAYRPLTKFVFPKYIPSYTGMGTPDNTAFKAIFADGSGIGNFGLVNIDINRACIRFDGSGLYRRQIEGMQFEVPWFRNIHHNIIIYGVRQNNAALPSPLIPTKIQVDEGHGWQRWPWRYGFNISVSASRNCAIINCRLNDDDKPDNFAQPGYITDDLKLTSGEYSDFPFKTHFSVNINFTRIFTNPSDGKLTFDHPQSYRTLFRNPKIYPELFAPGIEMKNNTVILSRMDLFTLNQVSWMVPNTTDMHDNVIGTCCGQEQYILDNGHELIINDWMAFAEDEKLLPKRVYRASGKALPYRFLEPLDMDKSMEYPLIVFFHGVGESGTDNVSHLKNFTSAFFRERVRKDYPSYVLFPQHNKDQPFNTGRFESDPPWPLVYTMNIIDSLVEHLNIDKKRIYLVGLSSGAAAVWETIARYPKSFAAALSFSGIYGKLVDPDFADRCRSTPVWHFHGVNDISMPLRFVQASFSNLEKYGVKNWKLKVYEGVAHGGWVLAMEEPDLFEWLFSHHDGNFKKMKLAAR